MNALIYIEGGASGPNSKEQSIRCQQAFHKLLDRMGFTGRKPRLVACGGRGGVFDRFRTAHRSTAGGWAAMWIDSEEPMVDPDQAWRHLASVTTVPNWEKPDGANDDQVLFMTTCMETGIIADRATLRNHYGNRLIEGRLLPLNNLESRDRHSVQDSLERATENCGNAYKKGRRSFVILERLDPAALDSMPSFSRTLRILDGKLRTN